MATVDPKLYRKYIVHDAKGHPELYIKVQKAIYGLLRSALLFYLKLVNDLESYGFHLNPYDPCVANMDINGKQMTVVWHVDDIHASHEDPFEITKLAVYLSTLYGEKLTVNRGKVHNYLGMDLDYSEKGVVKVSMVKYLQKVLDEFPEELTLKSPTPAADYLFQTRDPETAVYLPEEHAVIFHHTVAQITLHECSLQT